jgi:sugar phosphate permease
MAGGSGALFEKRTMNKKFPYRYRILIFLFFLTFITYLDRICISLAGLRIQSEFNLSNEKWGWVVGAFSLAYALFELPSGILGDRIGQRAVFIRIVTWWSLFTILTGVTNGLLSLIVVRFLFGIGESGAYPTSSAVISHWFPTAETSRGLSALFIGQNAGSALAPLIVIPIAIALGWRASFFVNGLIGLIWVVVCVLWFRNNPSEIKDVSEEEKKYIETNRRFITHRKHFPWKIALKSKSLRALVVAFFCTQWAQYFFVAWMPIYLQKGRHFTENEMKNIVFYFFAVGIAGVLSAGMLSDWISKKKGLLFGRKLLGFLALSILTLSFLAAAITSSNIIVVISLYVAQLCYSFIPVVFFSICVDIGGDRVGTVTGIMNFFGQMGAFFLALMFGKIADLTHSFDTPMFIIAAVLFSGSLLWLLVDPTRKIEGSDFKTTQPLQRGSQLA